MLCQTASYLPPKGIQKNKTGNTTKSTAPITPAAVGASASLPISSGLICNTGHSVALKSNSLLSVKHAREEGEWDKFPSKLTRTLQCSPDITAPLF